MAEHPLLRALSSVDSALDGVGELDPSFLPTPDKERALLAVQRELARLGGLPLQLLAVSADVADQHVARSAGTWLAAESRSELRQGAHDQRVADALARWEPVGAALRDGAINVHQANVVVAALDALPGELDPGLVAQACARLLSDAARFGPRELRVLGRRVVEVIAPEVAEAHAERLLREEERRGREEQRVVFRPRGGGVTEMLARVPDHVADRLRSYLDAFTAPRRSHLSGASDVDLLSLPRRRGEAFCAVLERIPADRLPLHGGTATSVVVTVEVDALRAGVGVAGLSTGGELTVSEGRRLACSAHILPAVLDGAGEVLDLGRSRRLFSSAQRKALAIRDRRCRAEDCDIPAAWCEAHHAGKPWSQQGRTDLRDGLLLCSFHHHRAHDRAWHTTRLPGGDLRYRRRT